ncbi:MAG TPA: 1-phosphofructokinase family hexose kinase [Sphingomicrobium sp.]|nr:1-phosphofructokinase family hexose kinase [Sphingomicrobium sp.]
MASPPVTTVTLNPTVDMSSDAETVRPTHKVRTRNERLDPGGGGINVARVLQRLSVAVEAIYLAGGATGAVLDDLLSRIDLPRRKVRIDGDTRLSLTVHEHSSGLEYRFVPEGPCASESELDSAVAAISRCRSEWLVLSGSLPSCAPANLYARMIAEARSGGARIALDSSGDELRAAVEGGGLELIKPSRSELEGLVGEPLSDRGAIAAAASSFVRSGQVRQLAVTLGHEGALLANADGAWFLPAIEVDTKSAVGAGDSFLAAMIGALVRGAEPLEAFRHGTAAGAATASTPGTDLCHADQIDALLPLVGQPQPVPV